MLPYIKSTFDFEKVGAPASPYSGPVAIVFIEKNSAGCAVQEKKPNLEKL